MQPPPPNAPFLTKHTEGARLSALHRGACPANQCRGSVQAVFPGTCGSRSYLPLRCPSPARHPADRSSCRPKRCPDRPGARLRALPAGTAPAPFQGSSLETSLMGGQIIRILIGDKCLFTSL